MSYNEVKSLVIESNNGIISPNLEKAVSFAFEKHKGQKRISGEDYIVHPIHVLQNVRKFKKSKNLEQLQMCACLHDTLEDTDTTYYDICDNFGSFVAGIVLEVTTDEDLKKEIGKERYLEIKMKNMTSYALIIKLCDRLDNISDLSSSVSPHFKEKYINETIGIMEFLLSNANLSNTHLTIIEEIIKVLLNYTKDNNEYFDRVINLYNLLNMARSKVEVYYLGLKNKIVL